MKSLSIRSAASKSAMTPSRSGRIATMFWGVRPIISRAFVPTASMRLCSVLKATTDGSFKTMPRPGTNTQVLAVPRSIARSVVRPKTLARNIDAPMSGDAPGYNTGTPEDVSNSWDWSPL